jgi:hypothetical protein
MRSVRTLAVLAVLAGGSAAVAAPRNRPAPRPALEIRAASRSVTEHRPPTERVLRELPTAVAPPGAYAKVVRWVEEITRPKRDGASRLVVVTVPGGLGLAWSRRW